MNPRQILRAEGFAVFVAATAAYLLGLDGAMWLYLLLLFAPDLSMLAYLAGPRLGSYGYNLAHTYVAPLALAGLGLWLAVPTAVLVALVWAAHVGMDRSLGYGLKHATGFRDTHLGRASRRRVDGEEPAVPMAD
jgi:hypothetical protein